MLEPEVPEPTRHLSGSPAGTATPTGAGAPGGAPAPRRYPGALYQGSGELPAFSGPLDTSGSLTGHILAQGNPDQDGPAPSMNKVMIAMLLVLGVLVVGGLLVAVLAGNQLTSLLGSLFRG
jgi:hypothetical protein